MRLFCKILVAEPPELPTLQIIESIEQSASVEQVLARVECSEPVAHLALVFDGVELAPSASLRACGLSDGATIHVICKRRTLRLRSVAAAEAQPSEAWGDRRFSMQQPAAMARRLRLDAARYRNLDEGAPGAWDTLEACARIQRERTETVVPSATPGALLSVPPTRAQLQQAQQRAADAVLSGSDSEEEEETYGSHARGAPGAASAASTASAAAASASDGDGRVIGDLWLKSEPAPAPPLPPSVQQKRQGSSFAWTPRSDEPPDDCLALEWAAGFSPYAGIAAVNGNELLYACGAVGVVQSAVSHAQRHLCGHRASVRALCVHPNGREIATAGGSDVPIAGASDAWSSLAARGDEVLIWDSAAGELQAALHMRSAVVELAFSPDGEVLACLCASPPRDASSVGVPNGGVPNAGVPNGGAPARGQSPHPLRIVSLWRWRTREHVATIGAATLAEWHARGLEGPIRRVIWQRPVGGGGDRLVLMARRTLVQWTPPALGDVAVCSYAQQGRPAGRLRAAAALSTGMTVTGCRRGELQLWTSSQLLQRTQAHTGGLRALCVARDGRRFASSGDDGALLLWDRSAHRMRRIDLASALAVLLDPLGRAQTAAGSSLPSVRWLAWLELETLHDSAAGGGANAHEAIAVGTRQGELHVLSLGHPDAPPEPIQRAHAGGRQPHALAMHPRALRFASVGGDNYLRLWAIQSPRAALLAMQPLPRPCSCVAFDADGTLLVVGEAAADAGHRPRFHVLSSSRLQLEHSVAVRVSAAGANEGSMAWRGICALRFAPNDRLLAVGTTDGLVHIFDASQRFAQLGSLPSASGGGGEAGGGGEIGSAGLFHQGRIVALDWADDSIHLRSGCVGGRLCCWDAAARRLITDVTAQAELQPAWVSCTVPSAWGAHGTWPDTTLSAGGADGCMRRRGGVPAVDRSPEGDAIVSGDVSGDVAMYRFPATSRVGAGHRRYAGHGCAVDALGFSWDDRFVVSIGADGACLVWRHWNEPGERELVRSALQPCESH